jgi:hypothetical protein
MGAIRSRIHSGEAAEGPSASGAAPLAGDAATVVEYVRRCVAAGVAAGRRVDAEIGSGIGCRSYGRVAS